MSADDDSPREDQRSVQEPPNDSPSWRQRLHVATGDRDAEAEALLDDAPSYVDADDAKVAVQRARGEAGADQPETSGEIATPSDAARIHTQQQADDA
jgi:hypothetical protein